MAKHIPKEKFEKLLEEQLIQASFKLREDVSSFLKNLKSQTSDLRNREIIDIFLENRDLAQKEQRGICQDTGYVQIYLELGKNTVLDFDLTKSVNQTVEKVYQRFQLRKSMAHPITRENTRTNTPAFIDIELSANEKTRVHILLKGGGSENITKAGFLLPTASQEDIENWIVESVRAAGSKGCPPYLIGVAIGGNLAKALSLSKRLLLESIDKSCMDSLEQKLSENLFEKINRLPIGFQGLRFGLTAMAVKVKTLPCHIATLPLAVSFGCNAVRQGFFEL